jgi:hypothetical protein
MLYYLDRRYMAAKRCRIGGGILLGLSLLGEIGCFISYVRGGNIHKIKLGASILGIGAGVGLFIFCLGLIAALKRLPDNEMTDKDSIPKLPTTLMTHSYDTCCRRKTTV